ncbi:hypothetical protein FQN54_005208 [Arachnomyces sp. PD_36]|nr:hypothetical protein FQN54_005208 [Arachnomyces sp. PD_36]
MASLLRQIVAGPRSRHPEAGFDLCYVTDNIIATSGPSSSYPKRVYRNPTETLVKFLDSKHGEDWKIWEFRAEGTGYPDSEVYGRIEHFPWPDHHPPPFALIPSMMASMRNWLHEEKKAGKRVVVVHCKAGKGRSGTAACSYLICEEGWKADDAMRRFTERRMRVGFGEGVSIPSQLRWVGYVDRWANEMKKIYVERSVEVVEVRVWGLRDGVKVAVEGFVDEGRTIKRFHSFSRKEREVLEGKDGEIKLNDESQSDINDKAESGQTNNTPSSTSSSSLPQSSQKLSSRKTNSTRIASAIIAATPEPPPASIPAAVFRPANPIILPTPDINIDFERRTKAAYTSWSVLTSIAHVWFNPYFEGGDNQNEGIYSIRWEAMDGIKGTSSKGIKALDRLEVVWRYHIPPEEEGSEEDKVEEEIGGKVFERKGSAVPAKIIPEPAPGEPVPERQAADWRGNNPSKEEDEEDDDRIGDIGEEGKENEIPTSK